MKKALLALGIVVAILLVGYMIMDKSFFRADPGDRTATINQFRENYDVFLNVKQYADEAEETLYVYGSPWRFQQPIIEDWGHDIIQDPPIQEEINRLILDFHFDSIAEYDDGNLQFEKQESAEGIAYSPNENFHFYIVEVEALGDNWYFYRTMYPD